MATAVMSEPIVQDPVLSSDGLYEVIQGQRVELSHMGAQEVSLANSLAEIIRDYLKSQPLGRVFVEMLFRLEPDDRLDRRPDLAYVPYDRWPDRVVPELEAWPMIPALAVEIVSKTNTATGIQEKIRDYFQHGVNLVWVIYPRTAMVYVYEGLKTNRILDDQDTLDGGSVLPGFRLPVKELFALLGPAA